LLVVVMAAAVMGAAMEAAAMVEGAVELWEGMGGQVEAEVKAD
jgi:hypothetical protein